MKCLGNLGGSLGSKPIINKGRLLLPLYSDAYQASIIAYTDNDGRDWSFSNPITRWG